MSPRLRRGQPMLSAEAWTDAALAAIAQGGIAAVAVEPLTAALGVTKGSFYWHFPNRDALIEAALAHWEDRATDAPIRRLEALPDPRDRLRRLFLEIFEQVDAGLLYATLAASANDQRVRKILRRVTRKRREFLVRTYTQIGLSPQQAHLRATFAQASYAGIYALMQALGSTGHDSLRGAQLKAFLAYMTRELVPE